MKKLHIRIGDFYSEVDENINMNCTYSIDDISNDDSFDLINNDDSFDLINNDDPIENDETTNNVITATKNPVVLVTHNDGDGNKADITNAVVPLPVFKSLSITPT